MDLNYSKERAVFCETEYDLERLLLPFEDLEKTIVCWVTLPLTVPGIVAGSLLVFIPATGEFVIPDLLGGGNVQMSGRVLYNEFNANVDWPVASAVAMVLLVVLVVPMMIYQHIQGKETGA